MTEGIPYRTPAIVATTGLTATTVAAGWVGTVAELSGKLVPEVQIVILVIVGLVIVIAEIGAILIALQYMRSSVAPSVVPAEQGPAALSRRRLQTRGQPPDEGR